MPTKLPGDLSERSPLAQRLVRARIAAGLSQAQVAQRSGLRENYIAQLETDKFAWPAPDKLEAWGRALGIPYEELQSLPYARRGQDGATLPAPLPPVPAPWPDPALIARIKRGLRDLGITLPDDQLTQGAVALAAMEGHWKSRAEIEATEGPIGEPPTLDPPSSRETRGAG